MSIDANVTLILTRFPLILSCVKTGKEPRDACWEEPRESPGGFGKATDGWWAGSSQVIAAARSRIASISRARALRS